MVGILRETGRDPVPQAGQMVCTWRQRFNGMRAGGVKKLRQLEQENVRLKKLLAGRDLKTKAMEKIAAKKR